MIDLLLCGAALLAVLVCGAGAVLWLAPPREPVDAARLIGWSVILGAGLVSMAQAVLGLLLRGAALRAAVAAACALIALGGLRRARRARVALVGHKIRGALDWALLAAAAAQAAFVTWLAFHTTLGWDGLVIWETKARLAWANGGAVPLSYFSDPPRSWTHPDYPLLLPLLEAWIYGWLGRPHQQFIKALGPLFFSAALALLYAARRSHPRWWVAVVLPLAAAPLFIRDGSASSGLADFPLGVAYLACVLGVVESDGHRPRRVPLLAALLAVLPWIKQEGILLWACALGLAVASARERRLHLAVRLAWPGLVVFAAWRAFLLYADAIQGRAFLPVRPSTVLAHLDRIPLIAAGLTAELTRWSHWGLVWPALLLVLPAFLPAPLRRRQWILLASVATPLSLYCAIYVFSAWPNMMRHLESSLPRLLTQLVLPALLAVASLAPSRRAGLGSAADADGDQAQAGPGPQAVDASKEGHGRVEELELYARERLPP